MSAPLTLTENEQGGTPKSDDPAVRRSRRADVLRGFGAGAQAVDELLTYNENHFNCEDLGTHQFPLEDEPFVEAWEGYVEEAHTEGAFACLKRHLVQLQFPIQEGISETETYRNAVLRGQLPERSEVSDRGISLQEPDSLRIEVYPTPAGHIPLLITECRADFSTLIQALTRRNEPVPIPDSMGASMVAGYNNWGRIRAYRRAWERRTPNPTETKWKKEFKRLIPRKSLYQDSFIILSNGPYSSVPARTLGLSESEWRKHSLAIRREHECAHYFTRRVFSSMRSNILDEFIADYMGIVAVAGQFRADWLLQFLGLGSFPEYRSGARLENYRGNPPLSEPAFRVLQRLVVEAAENVARFCSSTKCLPRGVHALLMFAHLTLEEMASSSADEYLGDALCTARSATQESARRDVHTADRDSSEDVRSSA